MELEHARWLASPAGAAALALAAAEADPASVGAAQRLRRAFPAEQAAAALTQVALRRRAVTKFGPRASKLLFTADALEQATRAEVASWRAARLAAAGVRAVVDLGCGIGADALAFADAGLTVTAVEADPVTAAFAAANLGERGQVICGRAEDLAPRLLADGAAVFLDPARRTASGRTWRVADFSPPWDFATGLLAGRVGVIKAAPGLPSSLIPEGLGVTWVSHRGDLVETSLWSFGARTAVLLPAGAVLEATDRGPVPVGAVARYLYEPDPAVIRSGALKALATILDATILAPGIAYLSAAELTGTPFATAFEVLDVLPYDERDLRAWIRDQQIGVLEIKTRGIEVDPAVLRRRLKPKGPAAATLVLTPTAAGAKALVVRRLSRPTPSATH